MQTKPVMEADLHAYADDQLDAERRAEVEAYLADDPEAVKSIEDWRAQREALLALYGSVADEPPTPVMTALASTVSERIRVDRQERAWWRIQPVMRAAAAVVLVIAGTAGGWFGSSIMKPAQPPPPTVAQAEEPHGPPLQTFAAAGVRAHNFYVVDSPYSVEMGPDDPEALNGMVSTRVGRPIFGPDLGANGFRLIGGRALPSSSGPSAQFMYQDDQGSRITVFVGSPRGVNDMQRSVYQQGEVTSVYWVDSGLAYALIGRVPRDRLVKIAEDAYPRIKEERRRRTQANTRPGQPSQAQTDPVRPAAEQPHVVPVSGGEPPRPKDM